MKTDKTVIVESCAKDLDETIKEWYDSIQKQKETLLFKIQMINKSEYIVIASSFDEAANQLRLHLNELFINSPTNTTIKNIEVIGKAVNCESANIFKEIQCDKY